MSEKKITEAERKIKIEKFAKESLDKYADNPMVQTLVKDPDFQLQVAIGGISSVIDGDYVLPKDQWGKSQEERKRLGIHGTDGGEMGGTPFGKLPNHPTFSTQSPFSIGKYQGGTWTKDANGKDVYTPSLWMKQDTNRMNILKNEYWNAAEKKSGAVLNLGSML